MSSLILFQSGAVPAHIAAGPIVRLNENASAGLRANFAVVSLRGKSWKVKYRGDETLIKRSPGFDAAGRPLPEAAVAGLEVIVVGISPIITKQYYRSGYVDAGDKSSGQIPDCFSTDGVMPDGNSPSIQASSCAVCPHNQFESRKRDDGSVGRGKACADNRKIALVPNGDPENEVYGGPMMLRIPATSMSNFAAYTGHLGAHGFDVSQVVTVMSFDEKATHPEIVFRAKDLIRDPSHYETAIRWAQSDMVRRMLTDAPEIGAKPVAAQTAASERRPMTYVEHAIEALDQAASDTRGWVTQLLKLIGDAPTREDVADLQVLEGVKVAYAKAPPAVIADINAAFAKAFHRLGGAMPDGGATTPAAEPGKTSDAPTASATSESVGFVAWLVDHQGEPVETKHGPGHFTDPVAYARALVDYLDNNEEVFPADLDAIEELNAQDATLASNASPAAKAILDERKKRIAAFNAAQTAPAPAKTLVLPPPAEPNKAAWTAYVEAAKGALARVQTEADLDAWVAANEPTYKAMPPTYRMAVKQAESIRRGEIVRGGKA